MKTSGVRQNDVRTGEPYKSVTFLRLLLIVPHLLYEVRTFICLCKYHTAKFSAGSRVTRISKKILKIQMFRCVWKHNFVSTDSTFQLQRNVSLIFEDVLSKSTGKIFPTEKVFRKKTSSPLLLMQELVLPLNFFRKKFFAPSLS